MSVDRSEEADARRFRWLLDGNGYFMEENFLCPGHTEGDADEADKARKAIDGEIVAVLDAMGSRMAWP